MHRTAWTPPAAAMLFCACYSGAPALQTSALYGDSSSRPRWIFESSCRGVTSRTTCASSIPASLVSKSVGRYASGIVASGLRIMVCGSCAVATAAARAASKERDAGRGWP